MGKLGINKWVPNIICNSIRKMLNRWKKDKNREYIKYSIRTICKRPRCKDGDSSLVFCTDVRGLINELKANCYDTKIGEFL